MSEKATPTLTARHGARLEWHRRANLRKVVSTLWAEDEPTKVGLMRATI